MSIYGRIETPVVDETTPVLDPDVYGMTKRLGEEMLAAESDSISSLAIRLPGVIGPCSVRNWLTNVLAAARDGRDIAVFNADDPFNNAAHIADLGQFAGDLLVRDWTGFDAVTVAAAQTMRVVDVVRLVVDAFSGRSRINVQSAPKRSFLVSSTRASERYGYKPMQIEQMLRRYAAENA